MTDTLQTTDLTREQLLDLVDAEGKKLGFYLATSALSDEVKEGIAQIIEHATFEQILALSKAFEEGYLMVNNADLDHWFATRRRDIKAEWDEKEAKSDAEVIAALDALEQKL